MKSRCVVCGAVVFSGNRCRRCLTAYERDRMARRAPSGYVYQRQRLRVLERDGWRCKICGGVAGEMDHIIELVDGGTADDSNCRALCRACHRAKTAGARRERTR